AGQLLISQSYREKSETIDISGLTEGLYLIYLNDGTSYKFQKIK
ncbi:MAG: T9SS type A sorting domain-containing protein, partial [Bacteroidetes bacterium]|nr:T9SS type A sorting domain-containing protein [Bacteroidota bacterium]